MNSRSNHTATRKITSRRNHSFSNRRWRDRSLVFGRFGTRSAIFIALGLSLAAVDIQGISKGSTSSSNREKRSNINYLFRTANRRSFDVGTRTDSNFGGCVSVSLLE
jgi:hypothetical protein